MDASGTIVNAEGNRLSPPIKLPAGVSPGEVRIAPDGTVTAGTRKLGQIKLVTVTAPDHLNPEGGGLLAPTAASGEPQAGRSDASTRAPSRTPTWTSPGTWPR